MRNEDKKRTAQIAKIIGVTFLCLALVAGAAFGAVKLSKILKKPSGNGGGEININDINTPMGNGMQLVTSQDVDYNVIPDKYNTGCSGSLTRMTGVTDVINGLKFKFSGGIYVIEFQHSNTSVSGTYTFDNLDFSDYGCTFNADTASNTNNINIVFNNCKFGIVNASRQNTPNITYIYNNCTLTKFAGSNSTFNRCLFGDSYWDCTNPFQNVTIRDCYFRNLASNDTAGNGKHSDGSQMYGHADTTVENVLFTGCRFEIPAVQTTLSTAAVNSCLSVGLEYNDASNIRIENCIMNGGGYTLYAGKKKEEFVLTNISFDNLKIGNAKLFGTVYPKIDDNIVMTNITDQDSLYVSSVWNEAGKTHVIVSNDTAEDRILRVVTGNSSTDFTISGCLGGKDLRFSNFDTPFEDFPFDIDISVDASADYVLCLDVTDGTSKQIRYVSFDGKPTYYAFDEVSEGSFAALARSAALDLEADLTKEESDDLTVVDPIESFDTAVVPDTTTDDSAMVSDTVFNNQDVIAATDDRYEAANDFIPGLVMSGSCGASAFYTLDESGKLTISGSGEMTDYNSAKTAPWYEVSNLIVSLEIEEGITVIGAQAFRKITNISEINIPKSVYSIRSNAFIGCSGLQYISLYNTVTDIGNFAFNGAKFVECTYYGTEAEWNSISVGRNNDSLLSCKRVYQSPSFDTGELFDEVLMHGYCGKSVTYSITSTGRLILEGSGDIDDYNSAKPAPWFDYASVITAIEMSEGITKIGSQAFRKLTSVQSVVIPSTVTVIGGNAFIGCTGLNYVTLYSGVSNIGNFAFNGATIVDCTYYGTEEQWNSIEIGKNNDSLLKCNHIFVND